MSCLRAASSLRTVSSVTLACISALSIRAACAAERAAVEPRAVIELFTSQGCSSCPPADKLIAEYARDPSVIALSLPVDYWDYLGWKDTLALSGHSNRQRAYAKSRGDREVYTPQVVVDGAVHALGSDKSAIERAIRQIRDQQAPLKVPVVISIAGDTLNVSVPDAADEKTRDKTQAEVWLCPLSRSVPVSIGRGENSGHTITYSNVVRRWIKLGDWRGKAASFSVPLKDVENGAIDSAVVMVQSGAASAPKIMLGAAQFDLH
jgi:hypothetical protein